MRWRGVGLIVQARDLANWGYCASESQPIQQATRIVVWQVRGAPDLLLKLQESVGGKQGDKGQIYYEDGILRSG